MRGPGPAARSSCTTTTWPPPCTSRSRARLDGVYNVAPDGSIPHDELLALAAPRLRVRLPWGTGGRVGRQAWAAGVVETPSALTPYLEQPWVVANDRLRATGWEPQHTNEEAFVAAAEPSAFQDMSVAPASAAHARGAAAGGLVARRRAVPSALVRRARRRPS